MTPARSISLTRLDRSGGWRRSNPQKVPSMSKHIPALSLFFLATLLSPAARAADELPIVFQEDFQKDASHWQPFDAKQWKLKTTEKGNVYSQHNKETTYKPPHRSPT